MTKSKHRRLEDMNLRSIEDLLFDIRFNEIIESGIIGDIVKKSNIDYDSLTRDQKIKLQNMLKSRMMELDNMDCRLSEPYNDRFWSQDKSIPTDYIVFKSYNKCKQLAMYWKQDPDSTDTEDIPSDLLFSNTLPLNDLILEISLIDKDIIDLGNDKDKMLFRVFIFPQYKEIIKEMMSIDVDNLSYPIGGVIPEYEPFYKKNKSYQICFVLSIQKGSDIITCKNIAWYNTIRDKIVHRNSVSLMSAAVNKVLSIWYGIQLSLLNPITERVIRESKEQKCISERKVKLRDKKITKTKYVKKYYIDPDEISNVIIEHRKNKVSCPLWYVIGHWREYKSGKKIFVKGYWKGVERDKMKNLDEEGSLTIRKRLLDMRSVDKIMKEKTE